MEIEGKVALVTGGARRLGRGIALALAERGAELVIHYRDSEREAQEVLEFVGLAPRAEAPAEGLNVPERKRMELARALAMRPTILFLDEVMAGLNPAEIDAAVNLIKQIRDRGITLMVIEHVMKAIRNVSDRIMVFHHGEKLTEGLPEEVLNDPAVVSAYLGRRYAEQAHA